MTQPVSRYNPLMRSGESDADFARRMGWGPGTVLVGNEGHGDTYLTITALGQEKLLATSWTAAGGQRFETAWTLRYRAWVEASTPLPFEVAQ